MNRKGMFLAIAVMAIMMISGVAVWSQTAGEPEIEGTEMDTAVVSDETPEAATDSAAAEEAVESTATEEAVEIVEDVPVFGRWDGIQKDCVESGGPVNIEEYLLAASDFIEVMGEETLIDLVYELMVCRQIKYSNDMMCNTDSVMVEPFFTKEGSETLTRFVSGEKKKKIDGLMDQAEKNCDRDTLLLHMLRGDAVYQGKPLAATVCTRYAGVIGEGVDCETGLGNFLVSLGKGDSSVCSSFANEEAKDFCKLATTRDPAVCKTGVYKDTPYEDCVDTLTAFKVMRGLPLGRDDKLNRADEGFFSVAVEFTNNADYCDDMFREKILPMFCKARDIIETSKDENEEIKKVEEIKKLEAEMEKEAKEKQGAPE